MIPKLIRLGVETILKIICEKIKIINIQKFNKKDNSNVIKDELHIKAESIIFNKINISDINIIIRDLALKLAFNKKKFLINNCNAEIYMRLTRENINKTLFNNKWRKLKTSIESFISMSFESIEINNKSIYFIPSDPLSNKKIDYTLSYDINSISLVNNINQEKLLILNDKNIRVKNLLICKSYIELEIISKVIFN